MKPLRCSSLRLGNFTTSEKAFCCASALLSPSSAKLGVFTSKELAIKHEPTPIDNLRMLKKFLFSIDYNPLFICIMYCIINYNATLLKIKSKVQFLINLKIERFNLLKF